jgi:ATP-dependent Clp protease ATP-binding subunit ClpC
VESKEDKSIDLKKWFRAEFINRIDEIISFRSLNEENVRKILKPMLEEIFQNIQESHKVKLKIEEDAEQFIAQTGYSSEYGVRELRRTVERVIQIPLGNLVLGGELRKHKSWLIKCSNGGISIIPLNQKNSREQS